MDGRYEREREGYKSPFFFCGLEELTSGTRGISIKYTFLTQFFLPTSLSLSTVHFQYTSVHFSLLSTSFQEQTSEKSENSRACNSNSEN
jgi:hypothetical protein